MPYDLRYYQTASGKLPLGRWLKNLEDRQARARIRARLATLAEGGLGDVRSVGSGVLELRIDWGPGYRLYFSRLGERIVLLLCAGDKRTQQKDIERAKTYFQDYKARARPEESRSSS